MIETFVVRKPHEVLFKDSTWPGKTREHYELFETIISIDHEDGIISRIDVSKPPLKETPEMTLAMRNAKGVKVVKTRTFFFKHPDTKEKFVLKLDDLGMVVETRVVIGRVRKPKTSKLPKP